MPTIINTFAQENPLAKAIQSLGASMFGDTLTPALKRQQLNDLQRAQLGEENFAHLLGSVPKGGVPDINSLAEWAALSGRKADDTALWNVFFAGNNKGPRDPTTTNAMAGAAKYGDSAENLDLNRANAIATNAATNAQKTYEFENKPIEATINGKPGFVKQGQAAQDVSPFNLSSYLAPGKDISHISKLGAPLATGLTGLIQDAPPEIRDGLQIFSGYRDEQRQAELFRQAVIKYGSVEAARKWVAPPGHSQHNVGNAADLQWNGVRLDKAPPQVRAWVHANAGKYGLQFRLANEPWHVESVGGAPQQGGALRQGGAPAMPVMPQRPTIAPIQTQANMTPIQEMGQWLEWAKMALPDGTPEQHRQLALNQMIKSHSKGTTIFGPDGEPIAQIGGDDMGGLTTANQTLVQRESMAFDTFGPTISKMKELLIQNQNSVGAVGNLRKGAQSAVILAQSLGRAAGISDISAEYAQVQQEAQQMGLDPGLFTLKYDPSMAQIKSLSKIIAFNGMRAIGGQQGNSQSNNDFKAIEAMAGDPTSWFTNAQDQISKLETVEWYVAMRKAQNDKLLGRAAQPAAPGTQTPQTGPAGITTGGTSWEIVQ